MRTPDRLAALVVVALFGVSSRPPSRRAPPSPAAIPGIRRRRPPPTWSASCATGRRRRKRSSWTPRSRCRSPPPATCGRRRRINGKGPFHLVVDSGAAGLLHLDAEVAKSLGLETVGEAVSGDPSGKNPVRLPVMRVEALEIGGARFHGSRPSPAAAGRDPTGGRGDRAGLSPASPSPSTTGSRAAVSREPLPADGATSSPSPTSAASPRSRSTWRAPGSRSTSTAAARRCVGAHRLGGEAAARRAAWSAGGGR